MKKLAYTIGILLLFGVIFITGKSIAQLGGGNPAGSANRIGTTSAHKVTFTGGQTAVFSSVSVAHFHTVTGNSLGTLVAATEGDAQQVVGGALICQNLKCSTTAIDGTLTAAGGTSWVAALDVNAVASALTCTETTALTTCGDTTHSVTLALGDLIDFGWTPSGTPTAVVPHCSVDCYYQY